MLSDDCPKMPVYRLMLRASSKYEYMPFGKGIHYAMDNYFGVGKRLLLIINPVSGKRTILRMISDVISVFQNEGFICTVLITQKPEDTRRFTEMYAASHDRIVVAGGDGTLNQAVTGLAALGLSMPLGYIPCGSTNDFARSMGLSSNIQTAARQAASGTTTELDIGRFGTEFFTYVAAFGMFTDTPYTTSQYAKNVIGHAAYVIDGIINIGRYKTVNMQITADGEVFRGDYLFGAVCNSTSVAGVLTLPDDTVSLRDGLFELLLIQAPDDPVDLPYILNGLVRQDYSSEHITFKQCSEILIENPERVEFSLDGERSQVYDSIQVTMLPRFLKLVR